MPVQKILRVQQKIVCLSGRNGASTASHGACIAKHIACAAEYIASAAEYCACAEVYDACKEENANAGQGVGCMGVALKIMLSFAKTRKHGCR